MTNIHSAYVLPEGTALGATFASLEGVQVSGGRNTPKDSVR